MASFFFCYDLIAPHKDYARITQGIKDLPNSSHQKVLESTWVIDYKGKAAAILEHLKKYSDENDRLMVVEVTTDFAYSNAEAPLALRLKKAKADLAELKKAQR